MRKMLKLYETSNFRTLYDMFKINMKASSIKEELSYISKGNY